MNSAPFGMSQQFTSWGLVLDGDVRGDAGNSDGYSATQRRSLRWAPRLPARAISVASTAATSIIREANGSRNGDFASCSGAALDDWERSAVDLYREIRRHRIEGPQPMRSSAKLAGSADAEHSRDASEYAPQSQLAALMGTAFPQLLGGPLASRELGGLKSPSDNPAGSSPSSLLQSSPLLLQYFLSVGYPLRLTCNAKTPGTSYWAALLTAAQETVAWFEGSGVAAEGGAPSRIIAPVQCFGVHLLPDVVQQMVAAHRMMPMTAAAWLLRVYVGLLAPQEAKEYVTQGAIAADHGFESGPPDLEMPPAFCMEGIWRWANTLCDAVYQLQTSTRVAIEKEYDDGDRPPSDAIDKNNSNEGVAAASRQALQSSAGERCSDDVEWGLFARTVLQQTTALLLRGCFRTVTVDPHDASKSLSSAGAREEKLVGDKPEEAPVGKQSYSPLTSAVLMPPAPTTRVALEGLACFALRLRLHEQFPRLGKLRHDTRGTHTGAAAANDEETAQVMIAEHWDPHAQLAVRQLPHLPLHYHHLVPIIDFVLTG
ncbi:hypothetical protein JKF63_00476 [Porcisia hertigi]|uniref:Uncharacterized protein n=1 Tax=Porcisia hertigi TaxID=2761500 RepID=A0A836KX43_9TRYP|nr:hypothetical protein JKF63_00476 [Porcisia hertigi]